MGDHRVGAVGVTSHGDGVVDRRPSAGDGCHHWYTRGGGVGRSVKLRSCMVRMKTRTVTRAACGAVVDVGAVHGMVVDIGAARGMATVSKVPTNEEG
jgi:hypothetical protein